MPRLVIISDTHNQHAQLKIPEGDLLIHAGDFSGTGTLKQTVSFIDWLTAQPHAHKIFIAGNHDLTLQAELYERSWRRFHRERADDAAIRDYIEQKERAGALHYLRDREITAAGLRIYGSPWQPEFYDWAFNLPRGPQIAQIWSKIPARVDVLVTHGPPFGILDRVASGERVGCEDLAREVLGRVRPRVHAFGHIHEGYGVVEREGIRFVNASCCDLDYAPLQAPVVLDV